MSSIAIYGPTGIGKTYTSVLFAYEHFHSVFICRHLEDLKEYRQQSVIIFDDIDFSLISPTQLIKLCDTDLHASIRILKKVIRIEPSVYKIFTHNNKKAFEPILASLEQQKAIQRRLKICRVTSRKQVSQVHLDQFKKFTLTQQSVRQSRLLDQVQGL